MELLEKYLHAVKFWLPSSQQEDIIAELRDDIRSQVEERESELGRSLKEDEWESLLKQRGRPLLVAEKYLPQRSLIGPILFPAYWFVLKIALLCYLLPWVGVWIGLLLFSPEYRAHHLGLAVFKDLGVLWMNSWFPFTVVTAVFAVLERAKDKNWLTTDWSPRKLPAVRDAQRISRTASGIELVANTIFGIWWLKILWTQTLFESDGIKITLAPAWHKFFWPFFAVLLVNTALSIFNFIRPYWTRQRRAMRALSNLLTAVTLFFVAREFTPLMEKGPAIVGDRVATLSWAVTFGLTLSFAIGAIICLALSALDTWRAAKIQQGPPQLSQGVAI